MAIDSFIPASSFLAKVEFDDTANKMTVTMKDGGQYVYLYVFKPTYLSFKTSPNHSVFYAKAIKGKLRSVAIVKHNIGSVKSNPLKKAHLQRGLKNLKPKHSLTAGLTGILQTAGLIPKGLQKHAEYRH